MVQVLEAKLLLRDEFTGKVSSVKGAVGQLDSLMGSLGRTVVGTAGGFLAAQGGMAGVQKVMGATVGAALQYEGQMAQIQALTGATKEDTDKLSASIMEMTKTVPKSPEELGAGAYFILSSGISDVADAAEVLEISAKASTVGLGETAVVADALTTVLNAYQMEASGAGRVTDILMQAVKDGKAEADAFAGTLGRVVPIAAQMGISFEEVAANMATFTRLGVSAEEAATGLRGVMVQLLSPSAEAKELLAGVGISFAELRAEVKDKGLLAVLDALLKKFKGNEEAIATLFPDVRGLTNVLATAGVQGDAYVEILGNMASATGNLDEGFKTVSETTQFKLNKSINDLKVSLQELGAITLPWLGKALAAVNWEVKAVVEGIKDLAGMVKSIPRPFNEAADAIGLNDSSLDKLEATMKTAIATEKASIRHVAELGREYEATGKAAEEALGEQATEATEAARTALGKLLDDVRKARSQGIGDAIKGILPTSDELGLLDETSRAFSDFWATAGDNIGDLERDLGDLQGELAAATDPTDVERLNDRISEMQQRIADARDEAAQSAPAIQSGFVVWRERLQDLAADYAAMPGNMGSILESLKGQHVENIDAIMGLVRDQGPQFAVDFAKWFAQDPVAAAQSMKDVMPGIMHEAVIPAIQEVIREVGHFNEEWKTNVIDALNALPEVIRMDIVTNVDPELWLAVAAAEKLQGQRGLLSGGDPDWPEARAAGGPVSAGRMYRVNEAGIELFMPRNSGTIIPLGRGPSGGGGGSAGAGAMTVVINTQYPPTRSQIRDGLRDWRDEWERAALVG